MSDIGVDVRAVHAELIRQAGNRVAVWPAIQLRDLVIVFDAVVRLMDATGVLLEAASPETTGWSEACNALACVQGVEE